MIAELTGMDASNASVYDGASALYEAVLLAARYNNRSEVVVARSVNPEYRKTLSSVLRYSGITVREVGFNIDNDFGGTLDMSELSEAISENTAAVVVQSPNFFGILEDIKSVSEKAKEKRALLICVCDPISLAVFEAPGSLGADIAVGEAQPLGIPMSFGGPLLGYFAVKNRLSAVCREGLWSDNRYRRKAGLCLTLQAREQHIRREKATSNICTNQALVLWLQQFISL